MASTRIKDLATTATQAASDDYLAIDGATNGTRKIKPEDLGGGGSSVSPYTSTPSALGTASAGSSDNYSRGDHVHAMPTASDVGALSSSTTASDLGAIPAPSSPSSGQYLKYNGSAWVGDTPSTGQKTVVFIAASDSADEYKATADYVCTGTNDQVIINSAMAQHKEFVFASGTYNISGEINPASNSILRGIGYPVFKLSNRVTSNLSQSASIGDTSIYVADASGFVVGQKIQIKEGTQYDDKLGVITSIDDSTGQITFSLNSNPSQAGSLTKAFTTSAVVFTDSTIVMGWSVENVTVEGIKFDGNRSNLSGYTSDTDFGSNGIEFYGSKHISILNNVITEVYKHGVLLIYGTTESLIENNDISNCSTHGIDLFPNTTKRNAVVANALYAANIQCHGGSYTSIVGNTLRKCTIYNQTGVTCNTITGNIIDNSENNSARCFQINTGTTNTIIANNVTYGGNYGIQIDGGQTIALLSNKFVNARSQAIHLYNAKYCNVSGNDLDNCNNANTGSGIYLETTCQRNKISDNYIKGTSGKTNYGIQDATSASDYNYVNNNVVYNASTGAVSVLGTHSVETGNAVIS